MLIITEVIDSRNIDSSSTQTLHLAGIVLFWVHI